MYKSICRAYNEKKKHFNYNYWRPYFCGSKPFDRTKMKKISVCMATYNGAKYITQQIASILNQLTERDEVVISDDSSTDDTINIIKQFGDNRIKLLEKNTFRNPVYNFENALNNASGDIIFLSDQDDIWDENKVNKMTPLVRRYDVVVCDCNIINEKNEIIHDSFFNLRNSGPGLLKNIYKNSYIGCCMAFNKKILELVLPFPPRIHMHDVWIGIIGEVFGKTFFYKEKLTSYRRHLFNVSGTAMKNPYNISYMIKYRVILIKSLLKRFFEVKCKR